MNPIHADCLESAFKYLGTRDRFESEVYKALEAKGFGSEAIVDVISHLNRRKLIDDRRTTQNLVARMTGKRAAGIEKLRAELERRGAPENIVEECLAELSPENQKQGMLDALAAKFKPTDDRARGGRFLLSRGFAEEDIESALNDFFRTN